MNLFYFSSKQFLQPERILKNKAFTFSFCFKPCSFKRSFVSVYPIIKLFIFHLNNIISTTILCYETNRFLLF